MPFELFGPKKGTFWVVHNGRIHSLNVHRICYLLNFCVCEDSLARRIFGLKGDIVREEG
jgi:hypothetical protein